MRPFHRPHPWSYAVSQFISRTSGLTHSRTYLYSRLIDGLIQDGVCSSLDCLYILAADTEANAKLNLKSSSFTIAETGAVTFTANQGYTQTNADASNYLSSTFNPSTAGGSYSQNSAHLGIWCNTDQQSAVSALGALDGTNSCVLTIRNSDNFVGRANSVAAGGLTVGSIPTAIGHSLISRTGAALLEAYKNGASIGNNTDASTALVNLAFGVGGRNSSGTFNAAGGQFSAASFGAGLTAAQAAALYNRIATYRTAIGL